MAELTLDRIDFEQPEAAGAAGNTAACEALFAAHRAALVRRVLGYAASEPSDKGAGANTALPVAAGTLAEANVGSAGANAGSAVRLLLRVRGGNVTLYTNYLLTEAGGRRGEFLNITYSDEFLTLFAAKLVELLRNVDPGCVCADTDVKTEPLPDTDPKRYAGMLALAVAAREAGLATAQQNGPEPVISFGTAAKNIIIRIVYAGISRSAEGAASQHLNARLSTHRTALARETRLLAVSKAARGYGADELLALELAGRWLLR